MKNILKIFVSILLFFIISTPCCKAVEFKVLVLPTDLFSVCDNYFCFPEVSEIITEDVITNFSNYKNINTIQLSDVRKIMQAKTELKNQTQEMLKNFKNTEKVDFQTLSKLAEEFGVKSILLITSSAKSDKSPNKRDLWEVLEVSSAFKTYYPYTLTTTAVLTDNVNNVIMWSRKYNRKVSDKDGYFTAQNQAQAASQLEKIKYYSKNNISQNISQNIHLRFFPKDVRTFTVNKKEAEQDQKRFVPNALEHLIKPQMIREIEDGQSNSLNPADEFIFEF